MAQPHELPPPELQPRPSEIQIGVYTPRGTLTNEDIEAWGVRKPSGNLLTAEGIFEMVGVRKRSIAGSEEATHYMANEAIQDTVYRANRAFTDPDLVLVSSSFPTGRNHAGVVIDDWGVGVATKYKDIHAACSGFVKGLVGLYEEADRWKGADVLFVASEKYSPHMVDLRDGIDKDPALSQTIFSDGSAAIRFVYGRDLKVLAGKNVPMFEKSELIGMPINRYAITGPADSTVAEATMKTPKIYQNGPFILRNMATAIPELVRSLVEEAGLPTDEPIHTFLHQGSRRTIDNIAARLTDSDEDPYTYDIRYDLEYGNYSSATIPRMLAKEQFQKGQRAVLVGFGAGLFASGAVVEFG